MTFWVIVFWLELAAFVLSAPKLFRMRDLSASAKRYSDGGQDAARNQDV
jgi:hypothetical protein